MLETEGVQLPTSRQDSPRISWAWWPLLAFAILVLVQTIARSGEFSGFVAGTKPIYYDQIFVPADGYVTFWNGVPVNADANNSIAITQFLQGQSGAKGTGLYDARAGYS